MAGTIFFVRFEILKKMRERMGNKWDHLIQTAPQVFFFLSLHFCFLHTKTTPSLLFSPPGSCGEILYACNGEVFGSCGGDVGL